MNIIVGARQYVLMAISWVLVTYRWPVYWNSISPRQLTPKLSILPNALPTVNLPQNWTKHERWVVHSVNPIKFQICFTKIYLLTKCEGRTCLHVLQNQQISNFLWHTTMMWYDYNIFNKDARGNHDKNIYIHNQSMTSQYS